MKKNELSSIDAIEQPKNGMSVGQKAAVASGAGITLGTGSAVAASLAEGGSSPADNADEAEADGVVDVQAAADANQENMVGPTANGHVPTTPATMPAATVVEADVDIVLPDDDGGVSVIGSVGDDVLVDVDASGAYVVEASDVTFMDGGEAGEVVVDDVNVEDVVTDLTADDADANADAADSYNTLDEPDSGYDEPDMSIDLPTDELM